MFLKRRVTMTAGLTWQLFHEPFARFAGDSREYLDTAPFRNNLFYSGAVEADLGPVRLVLRISSSVGRPIVTNTQGTAGMDPAFANSGTSKTKAFSTIGFSFGWDIPGL